MHVLSHQGHNLTIRIRQHIYRKSLLNMYIKDENYGQTEISALVDRLK